jgi:hypothetical protein
VGGLAGFGHCCWVVPPVWMVAEPGAAGAANGGKVLNAQVVTCSSRAPRDFEDYYRPHKFYASLQRFAEGAVNLAAGREHEYNGLMSKPYFLREWLRAGNNRSDRLIVCDAWDVIFTQHPHGIGDRCAAQFGDAIVFNGEKGCWPREDLRDQFPDDGSPWRFLNSGFMCGPAERIQALLEAMPIDEIGFDRDENGNIRKNVNGGDLNPNDQGEYQSLYCQQSVHGVECVVDTQCQFAVTLHDWPAETFDFAGEPANWKNLVTGTTPGVWHGNGNGKNHILPVVIERMGL